MTKVQVGVIGLGIMGTAMSQRLLDAGLTVYGYDRDSSRASELIEHGGLWCEDLKSLVQHTDTIITSLPTASALSSVISSLSTIEEIHALTIIETSTLSVDDKSAARDLATTFGAELLDCPLSGTGQQAKSGDLVAYLSGESAAKSVAMGYLPSFTRAVYDVGRFGNGMKLKLIANHLVAVHNVAAAEALALAHRAGLDLEESLPALTDGAGTSRMLEIRGPLMIAGTFDPPTMRISTFQKDLNLILDMSRETQALTPLFDTVALMYREALEAGYGEQDTAAIYSAF